MFRFRTSLIGLMITFAAPLALAQDNLMETQILFKNVRVFDGVGSKLSAPTNVLINGHMIDAIGPDVTAESDATVIAGDGRTLMPGLIDAHWHTMLSFWPVSRVLTSDIATLTLAAANEHKKTLLRGFTTVRDAGGAAIPIAKAVDSGMIDGPRMYPSGPVIGQTGGHGDWRSPLNIPEEKDQPLDYTQKSGHTLIADGVPEVMKRTREVLRMGASQVKAMAGGGVNSLYDPLDVTQYTFEEAKAICDVAASWNTYVMIHANTDAAIQQWVKAGAKTVEHGFFIEEETAKLMAKNGVWWSMQAMEATGEDAFVFESPVSSAKFKDAVSGIDKVMSLAKKYNVHIGWGTDLQFDPTLLPKQGKFLTKLSKWFTPAEVLKIATHDNAQMLKLSGPRDPYQAGELGVVKKGAYADLLLVDGNPLENLDLIADPEKNFVVIMKDGKVYKNTLQ
ncbi:amidohydrolase family protein [Vibrio fluvialis]|nr:amidohydrolase family protein [Vibrio fluvialis]EKO3428113.1 amidohydrolase family protein [Vibrio fluvialis]EKO3953672.1 amidohydrolase family protein [Vibrio fluvialis]EKO3988644.1 amidohydrolase family protein [Vibrio fluvialis]EKO3999388.1 amidohydrolase family protein [Vibrio fluvialis]